MVTKIKEELLERMKQVKIMLSTLVGVAQGFECWPAANQTVASLIPSLGHMRWLQARSLVGGMWNATMH